MKQNPKLIVVFPDMSNLNAQLESGERKASFIARQRRNAAQQVTTLTVSGAAAGPPQPTAGNPMMNGLGFLYGKLPNVSSKN